MEKMTASLPLVSIHCLAYNHESYLRECLQGFVMQQTNFKFEAIVHDDASSDNTPIIIQEFADKYPDIIKPIYEKENQFSKSLIDLEIKMLSKMQGKYIAFCEGDDYWSDPCKLQKQVDFLEANPEYGLVYGNVDFYYEKEQKRQSAKYSNCPQGSVFEDILRGKLPVITQTVCCRIDLFKAHIYEHRVDPNADLFDIDLAIWLSLALKTKFYYIDEVLATYRLQEESMSRSKGTRRLYKFHQTIASIRFYYLRHNTVSKQTRDKVFEIYYNSIFSDGFILGNKRLMYRGKRGLNTLGITLSSKQKLFYYFRPLISMALKLKHRLG